MSISSWEFDSPPGHKDGRLAQLARAPRLHRGGRRFKSYIVHIAAVAHVVERKAENFEVASASLARGTKRKACIARKTIQAF